MKIVIRIFFASHKNPNCVLHLTFSFNFLSLICFVFLPEKNFPFHYACQVDGGLANLMRLDLDQFGMQFAHLKTVFQARLWTRFSVETEAMIYR